MSELYLVHHGVKGMKWGVRHDLQLLNPIQRTDNVFKYGWSQGHGKNVYNRLQSMEKQTTFGKKRTERMNKRQQKSYNKAKEYWKSRASGKGIYKAGHRMLIKRVADANRSFGTKGRITKNIYNSLGVSALNPALSVALIPGSAAAEVGNEVINKIFGHF